MLQIKYSVADELRRGWDTAKLVVSLIDDTLKNVEGLEQETAAARQTIDMLGKLPLKLKALDRPLREAHDILERAEGKAKAIETYYSGIGSLTQRLKALRAMKDKMAADEQWYSQRIKTLQRDIEELKVAWRRRADSMDGVLRRHEEMTG